MSDLSWAERSKYRRSVVDAIKLCEWRRPTGISLRFKTKRVKLGNRQYYGALIDSDGAPVAVGAFIREVHKAVFGDDTVGRLRFFGVFEGEDRRSRRYLAMIERPEWIAGDRFGVPRARRTEPRGLPCYPSGSASATSLVIACSHFTYVTARKPT